MIVPGTKEAIVYRKVAGAELALDAYIQRRGDRRPAVIVLHGGGWTGGSRIAFVGQFLELLALAGYNWFSVDYRLGGPERRADAVEDVAASLEFIRSNAAEFRTDPGRIALLGEDSGAELALRLAAERPAGLKAVAAIGGLYDELNPARAGAGSPAVLIIHGGADREAPPQAARRFCELAGASGGKCRYLEIPGAIHRPENWTPSQWGYKSALVEWLGRELGLENPDHEPHRTNLEKNILYSPDHGLVMDAWVPPGNGPFPAVIIVHGGGWEAGDKVTYVTPIFAPLAQAGFAWFSIDYRLTPKFLHVEQLEDLRQAIRFVRENARRFRIDPARLSILGESASGQMVAQLATEYGAREAPFAAAVSFYGVYDFLAMVTDASPRSLLVRLFRMTALDDEARKVLRRYSPLYNVRRDMVPILLIHGTNERLWEQGVAMQRRLEQAGSPGELYALEGAPHGMENWEGHPEWQSYKTKLVDWLRLRDPIPISAPKSVK
jgi:alpha-L-fucosidase 2